jgi:hypothetical protein
MERLQYANTELATAASFSAKCQVLQIGQVNSGMNVEASALSARSLHHCQRPVFAWLHLDLYPKNPIFASMIRAIITGASGMVGEGVLMECLNHPEVESVLVVGRRSCGHTHPKLKEALVKDFFDLSGIESQVKGYNACYFCLGISSIGMKEPDYKRITYDLTMNFAQMLVKHNPDMTFCYVSGASTDSTEKGRLMWARVKGKTENDLMKLPFKRVLAFRPGFMKPTAGQKNALPYYKYFNWMFFLGRPFAPHVFMKMSEVGTAMINAARRGSDKQVLEVKDILALANLEKK